MTTTGISPASSPGFERQIRVASGSRPAVIATMPAGSRVSAVVTACRSRPPRLPRRSSTMPSGGRGPARPCSIACARWLSVLRLKAVTWITSASPDALREDGLGRHHGAFQLRRAQASVAATPGERRTWSLPARRSSSSRWQGPCPGSIGHPPTTIVSPGRMPASAPGPSAIASHHHDGRASPGQTQSRTSLTDASLAVLAGVARRHVAGIRIEVVEQFVEEALHNALRSGPAHRHGRARRGQGKIGRRAGPAVDVALGRRRQRRELPVPARDAKLAVPQLRAVRSGSSAASPRSPQMVSCETATGSSVRGAMKASAVA